MTATETSPAAVSPRRTPADRPGLVIQLASESGGPTLAREPVTQADLADAIHETWRDHLLRKGVIIPWDDATPVAVMPVPAKDSESRCLGYALEIPGPDGEPARQVFSFHSLDAVARRAMARVATADASAGPDAAATSMYYELHSIPGDADHSAPTPAGEGLAMRFTISRPPLYFLSTPLAPLLAEATASVPFPDLPAAKNPFPVIYTAEAHRQAEAHARKGAEINPLFESGAALAGALCSCPETGEFFVVVLSAFEVMDADQTLVSLAYSGESWVRLQTIVRARQKAQPFLRMIGQAHGHNFLPNDGKTCEACPTRDYCNLTNLYASSDDQTWSRAVFSRQPWQLCHIFGLTARGDRIDGLFTIHDGRLSHRGYHILPDFDPGRYPVVTA